MEQQKKRVEFDLTQFSGDDRAEMVKMYDETLKNFTEGSIVVGKVLEVRPNEILVDIGYKSEGIIPGNEFQDVTQVKPGDTMEVLLVQMEDDDGLVVLSKEKADQKLCWDKIAIQYKEGSVVEGVIRSRVRGGLLVDVDGVEAFLPGSQIDIMPIHNTDAMIGGKFEFKVIKISAERRNIIVSRRDLLEERMRSKRRDLLVTILPGQMRKGVVKNITDFGAFVDLDGLDGLLHITDMSWGRIKHPSEMVKVGDTLEVMVLEVDQERERVSLGLKQKSANPWDAIEGKFPVGSRLRGKVVNLAPYGAFVELEPGVEGLVHVSEISWTKRVMRASEVLTVGEEVDVVVLSINKNEQKIALGMRQTEDNPWDTVQARYPVGTRVSGKVKNFTNYGAFIELEDGIEGMIHVSDMSWTRKVNHPTEVLQKNQDVNAIVLEVDSQARRIGLGLKQIQDDPWESLASKYKIGEKVKGKVTKIASFGAFVELAEGIDGLVHISQIADSHVEKVREVLDVGQEVEARVLKIDKVARRIGLSIKAAGMADDEFQRQQADIIEALKPGEDMVDLAGAFEEALGSVGGGEEWHPGEKKAKPGDSAEKKE
jgi:small subunit ribosomal protein S1